MLGDDGGRTRVVEPRTGRVTAELADGAVAVDAVAVTPDGHVVTGDADGVVRLWDVGTRTTRVVGRVPEDVFDLAVSGAGDTVAVAGTGDVVLLDPAGERPPRRLSGHSGFVRGVAFSPDDTLVVSGGQDGTVRVREAATGQQAALFPLAGGAVSDVAVDRSGHRIAAVTDGGDGVVVDCVVCVAPAELAALAVLASTRELTADERTTFAVP